MNNVFKRRNLNRLPTFKEEKEIIRCEKKKLFEMVHMDVKYLGNLKEQGRVYQFTGVEYYKSCLCKTLNGLEFTNIRGAPNSHITSEFSLRITSSINS